MTWYKNMTEQQKKDFDKILGVSLSPYLTWQIRSCGG